MRFFRRTHGVYAAGIIVAMMTLTSLFLAFRSSRPFLLGASITEPVRSLDGPENGFAYVFYATEDQYACAALVNIHRLQEDLQTQLRVIVLVSSIVSSYYLDALHQRNVTVVTHEPPALAQGSVDYYRDVLLKLVSFKLHRMDPSLKRVLALDSDQLVMKNLDAVFHLPHVDLAAPRAYWVGKDAICSAFMLIELSDRLADRVEAGLKGIRLDEYDMDLVNRLLGEEVMMLPGRYVTLNSHWEAWDLPKWYVPGNMSETDGSSTDGDLHNKVQKRGIRGNRRRDEKIVTDETVMNVHAISREEGEANSGEKVANEAEKQKKEEERAEMRKDLDALYDQVEVLHFTALGKPWTYSDQEVLRLRPEAHPIFREQFHTWRQTAEGVCSLPLSMDDSPESSSTDSSSEEDS